jgi:hypothetical protein
LLVNDFTYSAIRSFNQHLNTTLGTATDRQLVLNAYPGKVTLDKDTVSVHFYDERFSEIGGGRWAGGSRGRFGELWCQIDVLSPPNTAGEPRAGANRQLKDDVEECFKAKARINLLQWDGTGGTTVAGGMYVRELGATWIPDEEMEGWCNWKLDYYIRAVDHEA